MSDNTQIKYKITKEDRKYLALTIEMWEWLAETGREKSAYFNAFPNLPVPKSRCFLCVGAKKASQVYMGNTGIRMSIDCNLCPSSLINPENEDDCSDAYADWLDAESRKDRKKYAQDFVDGLKRVSRRRIIVFINS